jgi:RNA polymerase sigma-54 factor
VLTDHLPALARGHFAAIAAALAVPSHAVQDILRLVRERLRPYPAFDGSAGVCVPRVVPDLVISERIDAPGEYTVELVEPLRVRLRLRPPTRRDFGGTGDDVQARDAVRAARQLLGQLGDRWDTLRRIAEYTVARQQGFLRRGPAALKPLHRNEVAAGLGLHESTVSRAVAGKYALLPSRRITPLAAFFGASGGLDEELRELVRSECLPLSDQELADRLRVQGYPVARRTVAKHRARLGIGSAAQR